MKEPVLNKRNAKNAGSLENAQVPISYPWLNRNALITSFFNASSVTIPQAERIVVDTMQEARARVTNPELRTAIGRIIHEETAHYRVHDAYNAYLRRSGLHIDTYVKMTMNIRYFMQRRFSLLTRLGICAATEHFTATMSKQILDSGIFENLDVDERMRRVWSWHALEELDHRSVTFDVFTYLGGGYFHRVYAFCIATALFLYVHHACIFSLLRQRNILFSWYAWRKGAPYLFGKYGIYRALVRNSFAFWKPQFHPTDLQIDTTLQKQLQHYHIESDLISYFENASVHPSK